MDEAERLAIGAAPAVRVIEAGSGGRARSRQRGLVRHAALPARSAAREHLAEVGAVHVLHREVVQWPSTSSTSKTPAMFVVVEHAEQPRLIQEQRARLGIARARSGSSP